jgi:DNA polymerase III subunit delta'
MNDETIPEADRIEGAPHPRETVRLFGQQSAEAAFLSAHGSGRLHHAWLITGPKGIGKATLAWRIARFLMTEQVEAVAGLFGEPDRPASLDTEPGHPVVRRMQAGSEARLFVLRRGWDEKGKRLRAEITVDETRKLKSFFGMSAADGGRRVVIVDSADEMNVSAANALLKVLEEPPPGAVLLLIAHQPARILPTIRSRCRELRCSGLAPVEMAGALSQAGIEAANAERLAALSDGSVGAAVTMSAEDGPALYARILGILADAPRIDRLAAVKLADEAGARGREARRDLTLSLLELHLARLARTGAGHPPALEAAPGEAAHLTRLAPDAEAGRRWAALQQTLSDRARQGLAVNLDASGLILDMVLKINETAAAILSRP